MSEFPKDDELLPELKLFPDLESRLGPDRRRRTSRDGRYGRNMEYSYCVSCGEACGLITAGTPVSQTCNDCVMKYPLPLVDVHPDGSVTLREEPKPFYQACAGCHVKMALITSGVPVTYVCDECEKTRGGLPLMAVPPQDGGVTVWRENLPLNSKGVSGR